MITTHLKRFADLIADGFRRVMGTTKPIENVTDLPDVPPKPFIHKWGNKVPRALNAFNAHHRYLHNRRGPETEDTKRRVLAKIRMHIAAPFLIVLAVFLALVVLYILYGKTKICLAKRKKDRVFAMLESQNQQVGYGSMARKGRVASWFGRARRT